VTIAGDPRRRATSATIYVRLSRSNSGARQFAIMDGIRKQILPPLAANLGRRSAGAGSAAAGRRRRRQFVINGPT
jgi:hypothetical protein